MYGQKRKETIECRHMTDNNQGPVQGKRVMAFDPKDVEDNKLMAGLSYVGILVLVPLLLKKDSKFAYEHAKQGLVMLIAWIIGSFVFWIPLIGWTLGIVLLVVDVLALVKALSGEFWEVPVLGELRNKFNL